MKKKNIKFELSSDERSRLKACKLKICDIQNYAADELSVLLNISLSRSREIFALAEFQKISSIGIRFAQDLIFMGYYSIDELKGKNGAKLTEEFEILKGYWIDPCVEDQFRLVVYYAESGDNNRNWWDFTNERKKYRLENGYPPDRPKTSWHEIAGMKQKNK